MKNKVIKYKRSHVYKSRSPRDGTWQYDSIDEASKESFAMPDEQLKAFKFALGLARHSELYNKAMWDINNAIMEEFDDFFVTSNHDTSSDEAGVKAFTQNLIDTIKIAGKKLRNE